MQSISKSVAIFFVATSVFFVTATQAQSYKKGFKYLEKGELESAVASFESILGTENDRPAAEFGLAKIYSTKTFADYDLLKAYEFINNGIADFKKLEIDKRNKLQDDDKGAMDMAKVQRDIIAAAYEAAKKTNTSGAFGTFLTTYTAAAKNQVENATKMRDLRGVEEAEKAGTFKAFEDWYRQCHPTALKFAPEVAIRGQKGLMESYIRENTWSNYGTFANNYPKNAYVLDSSAAKSFVPAAIENTISGYQDFLKHYPTSHFAKLAVDYLAVLVLQDKKNEEYDYFVRNHPTHPRVNEVWKAFYQAYIDGNGINSVFKFEEAYPNFPLKEQLEKDKAEARKKSEAPAYEKTRASRDFRSFLQFNKDFPNSPYAAQLEQPFLEALRTSRDLAACQTFVQLYPKSDSLQTALGWIFKYYAADGELENLNLFEFRYPNFADEESIQKEERIARLGIELHMETSYDESRQGAMYQDFIKTAAPRSAAVVALQRYIEKDIVNKNWELALKKIEQFSLYFGSKSKAIQTLTDLLKAAESGEKIVRTPFPSSINTKTGEYVPLMSADEQSLYFCSWDVKKKSEEIYVSHKKDSLWQTAVPIDELSQDHTHEGPMTLSADGNEFIIFIEGDLFLSELTEKGWSRPNPLPNVINSEYWDADATLTSDGNALLFVSKRRGVQGIHQERRVSYHGDAEGNGDIFVVTKNEFGAWSEPINLGTVINTPFAERTPFLHYDMKTLYFSSDGHNGLGRLDVYKSVRLDDTWTNWSTPINLGKEINTAASDWGFKISTDGKRMYYAAGAIDNPQNMDIYQVNLPQEAQPDKVCTVSGVISDLAGSPVAAQVVWEDLATGKEIGHLKSNPQTGEFFIVIPEGKQYSYFISKEGYFPQAANIDLREQHCLINIEKNIQLVNITEMAEKEIPMPLNNLFFDFNKADIKAESYPELNRLKEMVDLAKKYNLKVEIAGHTDNVGSDKDNITLSRNRAQAVQNYLIKNGCPAAMIQAEGYGEGKPITTNETPEGRATNRRVEVRFKKA